MTIPAIITGTLAGDTRRRVPATSKNKRVPLWTVEPDGQLFDGVIRVPVSLLERVADGYTSPSEHTNQRHRFDSFIEQNLARWVHWRSKRGWYVDQESLTVNGPYEPPEGDREKSKKWQDRAEQVIGRVGSAQAITEYDYAEEYQWYIAQARFTRQEPVYVRLEDMLFLRHLAIQYGVDPDRDPPTSTPLPEPKDVIDVEGGLDPMKVAEERRQSLGLKREDYLMGDLSEPL